MTSPITQAVLKSGLITKDQLAEFRRWKAPIDLPVDIPDPPKTLEAAASAIEEALESEGFIISRDTDLDILQYYLRTQRHGRLHVEIPTDDITVESVADIEVTYGMTPIGEYILPWASESIAEAMTNGLTFLALLGEPFTHVFFSEARELFYGQHKAFIICRPVVEAAASLVQEPALLGGGEDHGSNDPS